jgi:two-component system sensor histidine kinase UhpB
MSLRLQINLIVGTVIAILVTAMIALQLDNVRSSVREEIVASNRITTQLLKHVGDAQAEQEPERLVRFLNQLGRVRANDITLLDGEGRVLYRSPPSTYKVGREAPAWFSALVLPRRARQEIGLPVGRLIIEAEASRAVLDGWDDLVTLAWFGAVALLGINLLVFWAVGRTLQPLSDIMVALRRLEGGDFEVKLPPLRGREAAAMGTAFNRMAAVLKEHLATRERAFEAERRLSDTRELGELVEQRMEGERREIARALHDELGQSVTAIRSLAMSVARRCADGDPQTAHAAWVITEEAGRLYDQMRGMIPRLAPMALETLGLAGALDELLERARANHPDVAVVLATPSLPAELPTALALAAYRIAQEGLTNALRHSGARHVSVIVGREQDFLAVRVQDDGRGLSGDWRRTGHFGLRWLGERAKALGGELVLAPRAGGGSELRAFLALEAT